MSPEDRDLWGYFATLYKNSNKGIKGRGKDRKISPRNSSSAASASSKASATSSSSTTPSLSDGGLDSRRRLQPLTGHHRHDDRRTSYEDLSAYTGTSSDEDEIAAHYYLMRRGH